MFKKLIAKSLASDAVVRVLRAVQEPQAAVYMMHRFQVPELGVEGHDPDMLRRHLAYLRRQKIDIVPLTDLLRATMSGEPFARPSVAFTVDDGYSDFWEVGMPIFSEFDCPVTMFLVTDFVSAKIWNWWDRIEFCITETSIDQVEFTVGAQTMDVGRVASRSPRMLDRLVDAHKLVPDEEKEASIRRLGALLSVDFPSTVPRRYAAMSWDQVRSAAGMGATFGPHTVTHPVLSRVSDPRARHEITESWRVVRGETDAAVPVFCYPNGTAVDFTERDRGLVNEIGMTAALSTAIGYASGSIGSGQVFDRYATRRFTYPDDTPTFVQIATGMEGFKDRCRLLIGCAPLLAQAVAG